MRETALRQRLDRDPSTPGAQSRGGLVMICDVDLEIPDARRTHTLEVARGFVTEGFHVDLVTRGPNPCLTDLCHHRARGLETDHVYRVVDLNLRSLTVLCKRRRSAERCYVRHRWSNIPILLMARLLRYRVVTQVDDVDYDRGRRDEPDKSFLTLQIKRLATVMMGRLAHGVVAVTPQIKTLLVDQFHVPAERIAALPNGVDIDFFHPMPRAEAIARVGLDPDQTYLVFCGQFQPWVDFDMLLDAFALVRCSRDDVHLVLVGDGPERGSVELRARTLGVLDAVMLTGFISDRKRVRDLLGAATVTLASHRDSYVESIGVSPTKLAEYLAAGRAIVAKDVPGIGQVLRETGAGLAVPNNPQAMADAIVSLLDPTKADELGRLGRHAAEERYNWRSIVHRTVPLFDI